MYKSDRIIQIILNIFFILLSIVFIVPLVMLISASFSEEKDIMLYGYNILPKNFSLTAYKYVLKDASALIDAYKVTIIFSFVSMILGTLLMAMIAYPLTKTTLRGRRGISFYLFFTMLFSGGMVPIYILITQYYHLADTIWVYIFPSLINPWYVFMLRTFFAGLPESFSEAATIDGASEYRIFFTIILPLSKPVLATVALFTLLAKWNSWMESMLYINKRDDLISLQYLLQKIMRDLQFLLEAQQGGISDASIDMSKIPGETARMAMAVLAAGPVLVIFPFFQKYFTKGLTVGGVKG